MLTIEFLEKVRKKYMEKFGFTEDMANDRIFFISHNNEKLLALIEFYNYMSNDKNLYLFDCDKVEDWNSSPIAQIKFLDRKDEFYLRRLEYIDNNYRGKGYATDFMKGLEKYCKRNDYKTITGELIPLHGENEEYVQKFYERNGFEITIDEQNQKHINKVIKNENIEIQENAEELSL